MLSKSTTTPGSWRRFEAGKDIHVLFPGKNMEKNMHTSCSVLAPADVIQKFLVLIWSKRPPWMVNSTGLLSSPSRSLGSLGKARSKPFPFQGAVAHDPWSWSCTRCKKRLGWRCQGCVELGKLGHVDTIYGYLWYVYSDNRMQLKINEHVYPWTILRTQLHEYRDSLFWPGKSHDGLFSVFDKNSAPLRM